MNFTAFVFKNTIIILSVVSLYFSDNSGVKEHIDIPETEIVNDTNTAMKFIRLGSAYSYNNLDSALYFAAKSFQLSNQLKFDKGISLSLFLYASTYALRGDYEKSNNFFKLSLKYFRKIGRKEGEADVLTGLGNNYYFQQDYYNALEMYFKALTIFENIKNENGKMLCFQNIGNILYQTDDFDNALLYYNKMLTLAVKTKDYMSIGNALMNIGNIYQNKNQTALALDYFYKAIDNYRIAKTTLNEVYAKYNIASIYYNNKEYEKALQNYFDVLKVLENANDIKGLAKVKTSVAELLINKNEVKEAIKYLKSSLQIAEKLNENEIKTSALEYLAKAYAISGDYKQAYNYQLTYDSLYKAFFNEKNAKAIKELSVKYETDNKNKKIQILNIEKELQANKLNRNRLLLIISSLAFFIVLIISFYIYKLYNIKSKTSMILAKQKEIIENQKTALEIEKTKSDNVLLKILNIESKKEDAEDENNTISLDDYELFSDMYFKLKKENILAQYEAIKNQVNPHFLFNCLNVLSNLVHIDQHLAEKFIDELAKVYRYVLEQKNNELVFIKTEIDFVKSYFFLLKIRFEDKIQLNIDLSEDILNSHTIPLALQILLENAFKHNTYSKSKLLIIDIYSEDNQYLVMRNTLQPKEVLAGQSTKVGQSNIVNRFKFISDKAVVFATDEKYYYAKLPIVRV